MPELLARIPAPVIIKTGQSLRRPSKLDMCTGRLDMCTGKLEELPRIITAISGGSMD